MKVVSIVIWHLAALVIFIALYLLACTIWPALDVHRSFSVGTVVIFMVLSLAITISSALLSNHRNPYYFSWVTMISVLVKLGAGIAMIIYYARRFFPEDQLYVISFILAYTIFTVCEVWILQRIIKESKKTWKK